MEFILCYLFAKLEIKDNANITLYVHAELGLSITGCNASWSCFEKQWTSGRKGCHLLSVCKIRNKRQSTYNAVGNAVVELCRYAGLVTRIEDPNRNKLVWLL